MATSRRLFLLSVPTLATAVLIGPGLGVAEAATPHQSPIALSTRHARRSPRLPPLVIDYPRQVDLRVRYVSRDPVGDPAGCTSRGREETIEAEVPAGTAAVHLGGIRYELVQFHFHTASEHVLDGRRYPLEQHYVHKASDGKTLVVGLFLTGGGPGETVQDEVLEKLPAECGQEESVAEADLAGSLPRNLSTLRYDGSLTTSPYTEGVSWLVLTHARAVSAATLNQFQARFPDGDSRDLQPLGDRTVDYRLQ